MSEQIAVPEATWAERNVPACAVSSRHGACLAAERLRESDFYDPRLGRLFSAAIECDLDIEADRIAWCAHRAGVEVAFVQDLVDARAVQWDTAGGFASRIREAAQRREIMRQAGLIYNKIGAGESLADVKDLLGALEGLLAS